MCCFSAKVEKVSDTQIFARAAEKGRQFVVYSMFVSMKTELAMILPLPVPKASAEDALTFIDLEKYPDFFADVAKCMTIPLRGPSKSAFGAKKDDTDKLEVVKVGSFEASFVPQLKDFARLDERFKLPAATWDGLPQYKDHGFAVFKLKTGAKTIHPMAFSMPRANPKELFFPTVHIHDGKVHATAVFDHTLYCQKTGGEDVMRWTESKRLAKSTVDVKKAGGIIDGDQHVYRLILKGRKKNADTVVA